LSRLATAEEPLTDGRGSIAEDAIDQTHALTTTLIAFLEPSRFDLAATDISSMDGMSGMGSASGNISMSMMSVFQTNIATSLYSAAWTPSTTGAYVGTCIFIILLAVIFRGLFAVKFYAEGRWLDAELRRRYVVVAGKQPLKEQLSSDSLAKTLVLSENGVEENVVVVGRRKTIVRPWRVTVDPVRAAIDVCIAGVGYLL
jgi:hypothetical protein